MTPEELRNELWARKYAQQASELVNALADLNLAQQRIKALEEAATPKANVIPMIKEGGNET